MVKQDEIESKTEPSRGLPPSQWKRGKRKQAGALHWTSTDYTGRRVGRLVVLHALEQRSAIGSVVWWCRCECGVEKAVRAAHLRNETVRSCGCLRRDVNAAARRGVRPASWKHGYVGHPLYRVWAGMKRRCNNAQDKSYPYYGAKGIRVCAQWSEDAGRFVEWGLANGWEPGLVVDRRDPEGDYEPSNCRFITRSDNSLRAAVAVRRKKAAR